MKIIKRILQFFESRPPKFNLILFGPPGSGKGTQAKFLEKRFHLIQVSTGDLFRYELGNNTQLGMKAKEYMNKGQLVPDSITIEMLKNKLDQFPDCKGFIFDGFPRTIPQAEALDEFLNSRGERVNGLLSLKVEEEEIVKRLLERGKSSGRADDANEEVIRKRIRVYHQETSPVYDFFHRKALSSEIQGMGTIEEIHERLSNKIADLMKEHSR